MTRCDVVTGLDGLLHPRTATERMRAVGIEADVSPVYVRHKPGETTIVAYRFDLDDRSHTHGYAHWCDRVERADMLFEKAQALRPRPSAVSSGLDRLDERTVLYTFPNDARLRRLRWYSDPRKLRRSLAPLVGSGDRVSRRKTSVRTLRYKPERRVVNHVSLRTAGGRERELLVRYATVVHADALHRFATHLRSCGVSTPAPVARLEHGRVSIDEFIEGTQLRDLVCAGTACPGALAEAVAHLHAVPRPPHAVRRSRREELDRARTGLLGLRRWRPQLTGAITPVLSALQVQCPPGEASELSLLHGDLHAKNVLVTPSGSIAFVDLERMAVGDPAIDLGSFLAHGIAGPIRFPAELAGAADFARSVVEHYRERSDQLDQGTLRWHTAVGLVDQALLVTRHLEPGWERTAPQLLEIAREQLASHQPTTRTIS